MKNPNRIREVRKGKGVSRARLAELVGLHMITVYRHESGEHKITSRQAELYANVLGVEVLDLFMDRTPDASSR